VVQSNLDGQNEVFGQGFSDQTINFNTSLLNSGWRVLIRALPMGSA
jgi:hypothetical protein